MSRPAGRVPPAVTVPSAGRGLPPGEARWALLSSAAGTCAAREGYAASPPSDALPWPTPALPYRFSKRATRPSVSTVLALPV